MAASQEKTRQHHEEEVVREILRVLRSIKFGSVHLIVQDGQVVQIEKTEKMRFHGQASG